MKKLLFVALAAVSAFFTGCKYVPSTEQMYTTSFSVGTAAGCVANMTKIDDASRNAVCEIMVKVDGCVPETNQTFEAAWTPIAEAHVAKLVDQGKIDATQGKVILSVFKVAVKGVDYLFTVRFPKARQYADLVEAAEHGFVAGFLTVFKPTNSFSTPNVTMDMAAFEYLKIYVPKAN